MTLQTREVGQFGGARGWRTVGAYIDDGVNGAKDSWPGLNRLMADAHKRLFDVVAVRRFARFCSFRVALAPGLETFSALRHRVRELSEQMDTTTPTSKVVFLGAVAEL